MPVAQDVFLHVILDVGVHVLLGVQVNLLLAPFVLDAQLVEASTGTRRTGIPSSG